jgi:hypothetical protein
VLSGEATHINFIVFGLTRSGLEPTIYYPPGEQANHNTTDAVEYLTLIQLCFNWQKGNKNPVLKDIPNLLFN